MKERGIIFSAPMVMALLAGEKSQTRRLVKPVGNDGGFVIVEQQDGSWWPQRSDDGESMFVTIDGYAHEMPMRCPYGRPGDRLWVRETWRYVDWTEDGEPYIAYAADGARLLRRNAPEEWADRLFDTWAMLSEPENYAIDNRAADRRWRSPIHMPRWASRITLEITGVRVERLQDISEADAMAEGSRSWADEQDTPARDIPGGETHLIYRQLWESINGADSWDANPLVWVVEFRRC